MLVFPNAKINIGLNIVSRRDDGFHNIETIFFPVKGLTDVLEFIPSDKTNLTASGIKIEGNDDENLVLKAYHLLKERFELPPVSIHLHKKIPSGAGLGGGSSDASFMLCSLKKYFRLPLSTEELSDIAEGLGSDCPFFLLNKVAVASGKGDILQVLESRLADKKIVIIKPPCSVNTKEAYSEVTPELSGRSLVELYSLPVKEWKDLIVNDFEPVVFRKFPELPLIKQGLYELGAVYASMSGSGSAIYGIFDSMPEIPKLPGSYFCWKA